MGFRLWSYKINNLKHTKYNKLIQPKFYDKTKIFIYLISKISKIIIIFIEM